ncbi:MAG: hypothetical protein ACHQ1H_04145 [Nitrososphaerales archaeon]
MPLYFAAIAFALAWLIASLARHTQLPFYLEVPGVVGLYSLLYEIFRRRLWRLRLLRHLGIVNVPDLRGVWRGSATSSIDGLAEPFPVTIWISQNWTHILIKLRTEQSESRSVVGAIFVADDVTLSYLFENVPKAQATDSMHAHRGTAVVKLSPDERTLEGEYYSGRDRGNFGFLELRKTSG